MAPNLSDELFFMNRHCSPGILRCIELVEGHFRDVVFPFSVVEDYMFFFAGFFVCGFRTIIRRHPPLKQAPNWAI